MKKYILTGIILAILISSIQIATGFQQEETPNENFVNTILSLSELFTSISSSATLESFDQPKPFYYALPQGSCKVVFSTQSKGFSPSKLIFRESDGTAERNSQSGTTGAVNIDKEFYTIKVSYPGKLKQPLQMSYICGLSEGNTVSL